MEVLPEEQINLIVQADDYGACSAISHGILSCFQAGVVTQGSVIVPAADAPRAMWAARQAGMPLGVHLALMCEWDGIRWYPLTPAPSLRAPDGAFLPDLESLRGQADVPEAASELRAQIRAAITAGVQITHMESHVRVFDVELLAALSAEFAIPCRDTNTKPEASMNLDSLWHLSLAAPEFKTQALLDHVSALQPGVHMIVAHPAVDSDELLNLCPRTSRRWKWARDIRVSDAAALLDPRFTKLCATRNVRLASTSELTCYQAARQRQDGM